MDLITQVSVKMLNGSMNLTSNTGLFRMLTGWVTGMEQNTTGSTGRILLGEFKT